MSRLKSVGEIQSVFGTSDIAAEPHFHLPYMALKVLGYDVDWVSMTTDDVRRVGSSLALRARLAPSALDGMG